MKLTIKPSTKIDKHTVLINGAEIGTISHTCSGVHRGSAYGTYYIFRPMIEGAFPIIGGPSTTSKLRDMRAAILRHLTDR